MEGGVAEAEGISRGRHISHIDLTASKLTNQAESIFIIRQRRIPLCENGLGEMLDIACGDLTGSG